MPFPRESSQPRDQIWVSCIAGGFLMAEKPGKPRYLNKKIKISIITAGR